MGAVRLPVDCPEVHPLQNPYRPGRQRPAIGRDVVVRAYEVYCHLHGEQDAMMSAASGCRGGFEIGELVGFLYARSFPKSEWRERVEEAFRDMKT